MRYLEVIFYNISYDIKSSLSDTRILYIPDQTESSFFFVKYITESGFRFRIIALLSIHYKSSLFFLVFSRTSSSSCLEYLGKSQRISIPYSCSYFTDLNISVFQKSFRLLDTKIHKIFLRRASEAFFPVNCLLLPAGSTSWQGVCCLTTALQEGC